MAVGDYTSKLWALQPRFGSSSILQLAFGLRIADQTSKMTGLCQVCNTQDVRDLLKDAVKGIKLPNSEKNPSTLDAGSTCSHGERVADFVMLSFLFYKKRSRKDCLRNILIFEKQSKKRSHADCSATYLRLVTLRTPSLMAMLALPFPWKSNKGLIQAIHQSFSN